MKLKNGQKELAKNIPELEKRREIFILDTAKYYGNSLFLN